MARMITGASAGRAGPHTGVRARACATAQNGVFDRQALWQPHSGGTGSRSNGNRVRYVQRA